MYTHFIVTCQNDISLVPMGMVVFLPACFRDCRVLNGAVVFLSAYFGISVFLPVYFSRYVGLGIGSGSGTG